MGTTATPNLNLIKPNPFEEEDAWAPILNSNFDKIDALGSVSAKAIAAVTPAADRLPYFTSGTAAAVTAFTSFARTILDDADAATARTTLGAAGLGANTFTATQSINDASLILNSNSVYSPQVSLTHAGATAGSASYSILSRARGTYNSATIVASGDQLGNVLFQGYDGTAYRSAASIEAQVDGTPGANDMPGRLTFKTTPDGGTAATERMRIDSAGRIGIGLTPTVALDMAGEFLIRGAAAAGSVLRVTPDATTGSNGVILDTSWITGSAGPLIFKMASVERMCITSAGDVGIGTTAPANKFEVNGDNVASAARGATSAGLSVIEAQANDYWSGPTYTGTSLRQYGSTATGTTAGLSNASLGYLNFQNGSAGLIGTNGSAPIVFMTTSTERMRIEASGAVSVSGTLSAPTAAVDTNTTQVATTAYVVGQGYLKSATASSTYLPIAGTAAQAAKLSTTWDAWVGAQDSVVGMMGWKAFGNNHVVFDASAGTAPNGTVVNTTNAGSAWTPGYPNLMGWNGTSTYGLRVDSARVADSVPTSAVLAATAAAGAGEVGTYAFLRHVTVPTTSNPGSTFSGSNLYWSSGSGAAPGPLSPAGSWRALGQTGGGTNNDGAATLFLRIS